jgi:Uma2 family endonuclease
MAVAKQKPMTLEAFLAWQELQDDLYEFIDGCPQILAKHRMMAGATRVHDGIVTRTIAALVAQLKGKPCSTFTADIGVTIPNGKLRRPDVGVDCGKGDPEDRRAADPRVLIEVLSPTTRTIDQLVKLEEYKSIPGVTTVLIVDPNAARVAAYRRRGDLWIVETFDNLDAVIALPEIECTLALADIYDGAVFGGDAIA